MGNKSSEERNTFKKKKNEKEIDSVEETELIVAINNKNLVKIEEILSNDLSQLEKRSKINNKNPIKIAIEMESKILKEHL